jgi:hypothetical protein
MLVLFDQDLARDTNGSFREECRMIVRDAMIAVLVLAGFQGVAAAGQECVPGPATAEQQLARRDGIRVARMINSAQANQPGRVSGKYFTQTDLQAAFLKQLSAGADPFMSRLNFTPGAQLFEGWS